eukprot:6172654-Pleurochrysis_carterae.AAC.1
MPRSPPCRDFPRFLALPPMSAAAPPFGPSRSSPRSSWTATRAAPRSPASLACARRIEHAAPRGREGRSQRPGECHGMKDALARAGRWRATNVSVWVHAVTPTHRHAHVHRNKPHIILHLPTCCCPSSSISSASS